MSYVDAGYAVSLASVALLAVHLSLRHRRLLAAARQIEGDTKQER
jgi:heme exporter protein D